MVTDKGDPLLAHCNMDWAGRWHSRPTPRAKWAKNWLGWGKYRQFWSQIGQ